MALHGHQRVYAIEQRFPRVKRFLLTPTAPLAYRWAMSGPPTTAKAAAVRRLVVPPIGAAAKDYVREVAPGFRYAGNTQDLLGLMVYLFGVWEPNLSNFLQSRLSTGDTFIDVGANSGWFTAMGSHLVGPTGAVVGIEASPEIAARLRANLDRNSFGQARVVEAAALRGPGVVDIVAGPHEHTGLTHVSTGHAPNGLQVKGDALPALLTDQETATARVVKIDVEGAEYDVVAGLKDALDKFSTNCEFVVEVGPERAENGRQVDDLIATFTDRGFRAYYLPNFYDVHNYMLEPITRSLVEVTERPEREMDIVFSRRGGDTLAV